MALGLLVYDRDPKVAKQTAFSEPNSNGQRGAYDFAEADWPRSDTRR